jgi:hypothetical protein
MGIWVSFTNLRGNTTKLLNNSKRQKALRRKNHSYDYELADAYARGGRISDARKLAQELTTYSKTHYANPYWLVAIYSGFEDVDRTLPWLEQAVRTHSCTALEINTDPRLDFLRSDPRFHEAIKPMHLPQ